MTDRPHTVFVFESRRRPHKTRCVYESEMGMYKGKPGWIHTATIDPADWIEYLMNYPSQRGGLIEELMARKTR